MTGASETARQKVLVVDDDKLICWALEKELAGLNLSTRSVESGADAFSELRRHPYDLLFLDAHLPDSDGIELLGEIGRISPNTKIIVMSCDASDANRRRAFAGGALQFLEKPFDLSDVHDILKTAGGDYPRKRNQPRHVCRLPVRISVPDPTPGQSPGELLDVSGMVIDINFGGLRLRSEYPLTVGQKLRVQISVGEDPFLQLVPPRAAAEVVWVVPAGCGVTAGVKFLA